MVGHIVNLFLSGIGENFCPPNTTLCCLWHNLSRKSSKHIMPDYRIRSVWDVISFDNYHHIFMDNGTYFFKNRPSFKYIDSKPI